MEKESICAMCKYCEKKFKAEYQMDYECKLHGTCDVITGKCSYDDCFPYNLVKISHHHCG